MALSSNQIARKFSKDQECQFWLTKKQAGWLLDVWQRENKNAGTHFGRVQAGGTFETSDSFFRWEANEGYNGTALFKVIQHREEIEQKHPLEQLIEDKGLDFMEVMCNPDPELINSLLEELANKES